LPIIEMKSARNWFSVSVSVSASEF